MCSCTASHLPRCWTPFGMFSFVLRQNGRHVFLHVFYLQLLILSTFGSVSAFAQRAHTFEKACEKRFLHDAVLGYPWQKAAHVVVVTRLCLELVFDPLKRSTSLLHLLVNVNKAGNSCWNLKQTEPTPFCIKDAHQKHHKVGHSREQHDHKQCHACHSSMRSLVFVCFFPAALCYLTVICAYVHHALPFFLKGTSLSRHVCLFSPLACDTITCASKHA